MSKLIDLIIVLLFILIAVSICRTDATDKDFFNRSGLTLYKDYGTGCEYVGHTFGGVMPRIDQKGQPICGGGK